MTIKAIRYTALLVLLWMSALRLEAQVTFKTIVPLSPIATEEPFSVQYVIEDEKSEGFIAPAFKDFKKTSGPDIYYSVPGNANSSRTKNIVFTLVALKPGKFIIPGASIRVNGVVIRSNNAEVTILKAGEAEQSSSEYFLAPGEDPYEKMRKSLFVKVWVNKKTCYVGEPVLASFKLYSRLESKSDIVKNPGFYGFTVQDIINLNDKVSATEIINGKPFDVHTIRIVQLYPLQPGLFSIDPMDVMNRVEFSKSIINKKTEQEITEGVYDNNNLVSNSSTTFTYENNISTEKINIVVKPHPEKNKPVNFNGATGNFSILASVEKNELAKNEQDSFTITIRGKGNFTQLPAPVIQWPQGIEGFEPVVKDSLDKAQTPLKGSRTFRYPFIAGSKGVYLIPAVSFSFFDPDSNRYRTVSSQPSEIKVNKEEKKEMSEKRSSPVKAGNKVNSAWLVAGATLLIVILLIVTLRKRNSKKITEEKVVEHIEPLISIEQLLQPAQFSLGADDGRFYQLLQKAIWDYLSNSLQLSGSRMNKEALYKAMESKKLDKDQRDDILDVLQQCEAAIFTKVELAADKQKLLDKARLILEQIKP